MEILTQLPHEFQPDMQREPEPVTEASKRRSLDACRAERIANGLDPETGTFPESPDHLLRRTLDRLDLPGATIVRIPRPDRTAWELRQRLHRLETEAEGLKVRLSQLHDEIEDCYRQLKGEQ
jgi:hypothetical protein